MSVMNNLKYFNCLRKDLDATKLLEALSGCSDLWNLNRLRTEQVYSPHKDTSDILLRFNRLDEFGNHSPWDVKCVGYPPWERLPEAHDLINEVFPGGFDHLGRCLITKLPSGKMIFPHADGGAIPLAYHRFHIPIQTNNKVIFSCANETVNMRPGECWWFDNRVEHTVINGGVEDRLHLIFDLKAEFSSKYIF